MKCLDCWREVDIHERGQGGRKRCFECSYIHKRKNNIIKQRKKYEIKKKTSFITDQLLYSLKQQDCSVGMLCAFCNIEPNVLRSHIHKLRKRGNSIRLIEYNSHKPYVEKFYTLKA